MTRLARTDLARHASIRGMQLSRAACTLESIAERLNAIRWEDPERTAAELAGMALEASGAVLAIATVAGFHDALATVDYVEQPEPPTEEPKP